MRTRILFFLIGIFFSRMAVVGQEAAPDSIAVCPPGEPAEMIIVAPEEMVTESAKQDPPQIPESDGNGSRILTAEEIVVATDSIVGNYDADWTDLSMQGKLTFDGLPMSVSVKIYMKRGESVILSARAPFFGEVARVEINQDSITLINKHTRCYNTQPLGDLAVDRRAYLSDLQDILLGQVAFPGHGHLSAENAMLSQWISIPTSEVLLYPGAELQTAGTEYGFVIEPEDWQLRSFLLMLNKSGVLIETGYLYGEKGWTLGLDISLPKKKMKGEVQLSYPRYDDAPLEFTKLGEKYRKVGFRELMKF